MEALVEPVSPELVLVTPGLRSLLVDRSQAEDEDVLRPREAPEAVQAVPEGASRRMPILAQFALYAGWQAVTGALFGFVAFAVFVALLLLKPLIPG